MNLRESFSAATESLAANKMRSGLTMLGVIIGVSAVITMLAIASGARDQMMSNIRKMGTNVLIVMSGQTRRGAVMGGFGSVQSLTLDDSRAIREECPSVAKSTAEVMNAAQVKYGNKNTNVSISGTETDYPSVRNYTIREGRFFNEHEVRYASKVAVVGPTAAKDLFGTASPVGKTVRIKNVPFRVIGVTEEKGAGGFGDPDNQFFVPVTTAMRRLFGLEYVRTISVQAKSMELMDQASKEITALLSKRHKIRPGTEPDFIIRNQAEVMQMANQAAGIFTLLLGGIASVSLLVGGIGIMNIMLVSVTERTKEIGLRKAVGAKRRDIQWQFLVEALVLSLVGGAVGTSLGMIAAYIISSVSGWNVGVSVPSILLAFGFSAFIGIFFGMYPARKASALDPIEALRYE